MLQQYQHETTHFGGNMNKAFHSLVQKLHVLLDQILSLFWQAFDQTNLQYIIIVTLLQPRTTVSLKTPSKKNQNHDVGDEFFVIIIY